MRKNQSEIIDLILVTIVLGFCFSFREWGVDGFNASIGLQNFFIVTLLTALSIGVHEIAHELIGPRYKAKIITKTWKPVLLLALLITFLTNGWIVFAAVWSVIIISPVYRPGRIFPHTGPYERAIIGVVGPLTNIVLLLISAFLYTLNPIFIFEKLMFINATLAVFNLFPFFRFAPLFFAKVKGRMSGERMRILHRTLTNLRKTTGDIREIPFMEGELVFFGSKPIWSFVFSFAFFVSFVLITSKEWFSSVVSALVFATIMYFLWMFFLEPWSYEYGSKAKIPKPWK